MTEVRILPYSHVVGQTDLRRCLELAFIAPGIGGVLVSGERGTAKSTTVRSFSLMAYGGLPITLPINATEDRVLGGWSIDALMTGRTEWQAGLLEAADKQGLLYIDEVNLLDDHLVNIILDVTSTNVLVVHREGLDRPAIAVKFTLVGTMNPEEGWLRPQLLDRFGLLVPVSAETAVEQRHEILRTVLRFEEEITKPASSWLEQGAARDREIRKRLEQARARVGEVRTPDEILGLCSRIAARFEVAGHRGEKVMALAARAQAALNGHRVVTSDDVGAVAEFALAHRLPEAVYGESIKWTTKERDQLNEIISG
ncbi:MULTISPECIES: AAA family ATPase [unclassified Streptosporangium]|uniref:AAA family ATPase n=1 Tax=unclassified Streptosporangium TaxID=2632669 RepID=UPI002E281820|nr:MULTISPECIES: AAA family ATPase [unclassified Streptosporangium]